MTWQWDRWWMVLNKKTRGSCLRSSRQLLNWSKLESPGSRSKSSPITTPGTISNPPWRTLPPNTHLSHATPGPEPHRNSLSRTFAPNDSPVYTVTLFSKPPRSLLEANDGFVPLRSFTSSCESMVRVQKRFVLSSRLFFKTSEMVSGVFQECLFMLLMCFEP